MSNTLNAMIVSSRMDALVLDSIKLPFESILIPSSSIVHTADIAPRFLPDKNHHLTNVRVKGFIASNHDLTACAAWPTHGAGRFLVNEGKLGTP